MCSHDMLNAIKEFTQSPGHGSLTVLVIMSHGDELGNILGGDRKATCTVQQMVDAFCDPQIKHSTKVLCVIYPQFIVLHNSSTATFPKDNIST